MERVRDLKTRGADAGRRGGGDDRVDRSCAPRHHDVFRTVHRRNRHLRAPRHDQFANANFIRHDGHHRPIARQRAHEPSARRHQRECIRQRDTSGDARRHKLADAVAHHGRRAHAPVHPHCGDRVFNREQRRLRAGGVVELCGGDTVVEQQREQRHRNQWLQNRRTFIQRRLERRLRVVQRARHTRILRPLSGEQKRDLRRPYCGSPALNCIRRVSGSKFVECCDRLCRGARGNGHALRLACATDIRRVREIGERHLPIGKCCAILRRQRAQCRVAARRDRKQMTWALDRCCC